MTDSNISITTISTASGNTYDYSSMSSFGQQLLHHLIEIRIKCEKLAAEFEQHCHLKEGSALADISQAPPASNRPESDRSSSASLV